MEEQFDIQISYVSKLVIREGGNYVFSYYTDGANTIDKYIKIKGE